MFNLQELIDQIKEGGTIWSSSKERQKEKKAFDNYQDNKRNIKEKYPKMPSGFECFVCGMEFATNEERIQHLEEDPHGSMYNTGSPQEREDTRRLQNTNR